MVERTINIDGRIYRRSPDGDRYQVPIHELGDLRLRDIPAHSGLEPMGLPQSDVGYRFYLYVDNGAEEGSQEYLGVWGGAELVVQHDPSRPLARLRRAFPEMEPIKDVLPNPMTGTNVRDGVMTAFAHLTLNYPGCGDTLVREAIAPFIQAFERLRGPDVRLFICHASEDKATAREVALFMKGLGADVWFDEWEIRVGDSIVERINGALGVATHLVLLLSEYSVNKRWVLKEFSAALMRQLSENSIAVLPLRLDDSPVPPILADVRYADARPGLERALRELEQSLNTISPSPGGT